MISGKETEHIAKLARLKLTEGEKNKLQKELSAILDYINKLKEVNIEGIEPTSHSVIIKNILRKDEVKNSDSGTKKSLIKQAPAKENNHFRVKPVF